MAIQCGNSSVAGPGRLSDHAKRSSKYARVSDQASAVSLHHFDPPSLRMHNNMIMHYVLICREGVMVR